MPRAVRVRISQAALHALLLPVEWAEVHITHAAVHYEGFRVPTLELILEGEVLPPIYAVEEGAPVREGQLLVHHDAEGLRLEIRPIP